MSQKNILIIMGSVILVLLLAIVFATDTFFSPTKKIASQIPAPILTQEEEVSSQDNNSELDDLAESDDETLDFEGASFNSNQEKEIALQDFQENFAPKILSCEVGETYKFNVRGVSIPFMSAIKIDNTSYLSILGGDVNNCQIKQEVTDIFHYIADADSGAKEEFYDFLDFLAEDLEKDIDELLVIFQTPLQVLSVENKNLLEDLDFNLDFDYNSVLTPEQFLLQTMIVGLEEEVSKLNESEEEAAVSFCSGPSSSLVDIFTFFLKGEMPFSVGVSLKNSEAVTTYENDVICTSSAKIIYSED